MLPLTPYVLVGGRSSRMGRDKAFVPWQGSTLLEEAIARLAVFGPARLLRGDAADLSRAAQLAPFGVLVPDRTAGSGPLGGLDAALQDVPTAWALVLPIDQPCLPQETLLRWAQQVCHSTATASWFTHAEGVEPLPLLVHRSLGAAIARALAEGQRRLLPAIQAAAGTHALPFAAERTEWFRNLNHPADLSRSETEDRVD